MQVTGQVKFVDTFIQTNEARRIEERIIPGVDDLADEDSIDRHRSIVSC